METDNQTVIRIPLEGVKELSSLLLQAVGLSKSAAAAVTESIILAERSGRATHGLITLPYYIRALESGQLNPKATLERISDRGAYILFDANGGVGRCLLREVVDYTVERAKVETGICYAQVRNIGHVGVLGEYCERAVSRGCLALVFAGSINQPENALVAPSGANVRFLGSNPIACGVPTAFGAPFIFDGATAETSFFAVKQALDLNRDLPTKSIVSNLGELSSDPHDFFNGGALAPLGGVKGFGLGLLCGLLSGIGEDGPVLARMGGVAFMALDMDIFGRGDEVKLRVARVLEKLADIPQGDGKGRYPGCQRHERLQSSFSEVPISVELYKVLAQTAIRLDVKSKCLW